MKTNNNFSSDTILKAIGSIKLYGYMKGVKGYEKRDQLLHILIYEFGYVKNNGRELTERGDEYFRNNFLRFDEITSNMKSFI
jgi:hypothetical protein